MTSRERWIFGGWSVLFVVALLVVGLRFSVTTDITEFLPSDASRVEASIASEVAASELSRTMIISLSSDSPSETVRASVAFEAAVSADAELSAALSFVEGGPPEGTDAALWELYFSRRLSFAADSPAAASALITDAGLERASQRLLRFLEQPMSPLFSRVAPSDPLLIVPDLFERLQQGRAAEIAIEGGRFITTDGAHALLFVGTRASAFDASAQRVVLDGLERARVAAELALREAPPSEATPSEAPPSEATADEVDAQRLALDSPTIVMEQSGVGRFSVRSEQAIKADIRRVSIASILSITVLLWVLFRSFRLALLAMVPIGGGMVFASAISLILFGRLHGITLAFGASLIGVSLDYVVHFYARHASQPSPEGPEATARALWPTLATGAATTVVGFLALALSGFAGLREVALFAATGVIFALLITRFVLPIISPHNPPEVPARRALIQALTRLMRTLSRRRRLLWVLPAAAVLWTALMLPRVEWSERARRGPHGRGAARPRARLELRAVSVRRGDRRR